jgi:2-polyprenyl-3-methyl-5-hydroxy-6-metoxy-1,4-benzoquinol methylase
MDERDTRAENDRRIAQLNSLWRVVGPAPADGSPVHKALFQVRKLVAVLLRPQETFNAAVVEYINANATLHERLGDLVVQSRETVDDVLRHQESLAARERRIQAGMDAMREAHDELRTSVGVLQQATQLLRQEIGRLRQSSDQAGSSQAPDQGAPASGVATAVTRAHDALEHKYVGFEDRFRGSPESIRERLREYVPIFAGAADVLDVGCGRGEFLELLREQGVSARGIDANEAMVQVCREKGLRADAGDALAFLRAIPERSLGGLIAAQVVEHLEPSYLAAFLDAAFNALRPGAPIVLETINVASWFAFFQSYIRDITHVRPLHPETLKYLLVATGFHRVDVRYRVPYPEHEKLQPIPQNETLADSVETLNANVEKINRLLFTYLDYAAIGYRP